jgi:hypothetical protein
MTRNPRLVAPLLLLLPLLLLAPTGPRAQVYKWVDANGVTHYGSQPPPNNKSKEVQLREAAPRQVTDAQASAYTSSLKERELEFRKRQTLREREETRVAEERAKRNEECRRDKAELTDLRNTRRMYEVNDKGERVYMSDAQRDAEVARREAEYNRKCA